MEKTVGELTTTELQVLVGNLIEEKLLDILGEPDAGMEIRDSLRQRLECQQQEVAAGERGQSFDEVVRQSGLA